MQPVMIALGAFFFKWRNLLFPLMVAAAWIAVPPNPAFLGSERLGEIKDMVAIGIVASGVALRLAVLGFTHIRRGGHKLQVAADRLETRGVFGLTRNPLYVGNILVWLGVFVMHGNPLLILAGTAQFAFIYHCLVLNEEAFLAAKFGGAYAEYRQTVPRWAFRMSRWRASFEGMRWSGRRALLTDYTALANGFGLIAITELVEHLRRGESLQVSHHALWSAVAIAALTLWVLAVRLYKRSPQVRASLRV